MLTSIDPGWPRNFHQFQFFWRFRLKNESFLFIDFFAEIIFAPRRFSLTIGSILSFFIFLRNSLNFAKNAKSRELFKSVLFFFLALSSSFVFRLEKRNNRRRLVTRNGLIIYSSPSGACRTSTTRKYENREKMKHLKYPIKRIDDRRNGATERRRRRRGRN